MAETDEQPRSTTMRRRILAAASQEFRERGFHGARMSDIAERLGMAVGNLYNYISNKKELLRYCQSQTLEALQRGGERISALPLPPSQRLHLLIVAHVRCLNELFPGALAHLELELIDEPHRSDLRVRRSRYEQLFHRLIGEGIGAGELIPTDVKVTTFAFLGAINWTVKWFRPDGPLDARAVGESHARTLVRGLIADASLSYDPPRSIDVLALLQGDEDEEES